MPFIVDNNFDDVLSAMADRARKTAYVMNDRATEKAQLDGHRVEVTANRRIVRDRATIAVTWFVDGRRKGLNAVRGVLRRGA